MVQLQEGDFSVQVTQENLTNTLKPIATSPDLWAARHRPLSFGEEQTCQCQLGESRWHAQVSRTDICARLAELAARVNSLTGSGI